MTPKAGYRNLNTQDCIVFDACPIIYEMSQNAIANVFTERSIHNPYLALERVTGSLHYESAL
jgi:hypothetical protein